MILMCNKFQLQVSIFGKDGGHRRLITRHGYSNDNHPGQREIFVFRIVISLSVSRGFGEGGDTGRVQLKNLDPLTVLLFVTRPFPNLLLLSKVLYLWLRFTLILLISVRRAQSVYPLRHPVASLKVVSVSGGILRGSGPSRRSEPYREGKEQLHHTLRASLVERPRTLFPSTIILPFPLLISLYSLVLDRKGL